MSSPFLRAYHGGFNMGFNCAEAVNFAPADWLRFGELSRERYRAFRKPSLLCHEWLLFKVRSGLSLSCRLKSACIHGHRIDGHIVFLSPALVSRVSWPPI